MKISLRPWEQSGCGSGADGNIRHSPATHSHTNNNGDKSVRLKDIKDTMTELRNDISSIHECISSEVKLLNGKMEQLEECVIKCLEREPTIIKEEDLDNEQRRNIANGTAAEEEVNEVAAISNSLGERGGLLHGKENSNKKQQGQINKQKNNSKKKKAKKKKCGDSTPSSDMIVGDDIAIRRDCKATSRSCFTDFVVFGFCLTYYGWRSKFNQLKKTHSICASFYSQVSSPYQY